MNAITLVDQSLKAMTLEELFAEAEKFGDVYIFSDRSKPNPNCYRAQIEFQSIPGTTLEASSDRGLSIKTALMQAIDRSKRIVEAYK